MKKNLALILLVFLFTYSELAAQGLEKLGIDTSGLFEMTPLNIGDPAPKISATDHLGEPFSLSTALNDGPVVLIFYRGYWCPVCKRHLSEFENDLYQLKAKGVQVVAVSPETIENVEKTIEKTELSTRVISDRDYSIIKSYGVAFLVTEKYQKKINTFLFADIAEANAHDDAVLPIPATYIIGQDGLIKYVHFDPNYKNRASVGELLEYID